MRLESGIARGFWGRAVVCSVVVAAAAYWLARRADGPLGMFPGGPFRQESESCHDVDWAEYTDVSEIELELRPDAPRSITTWSVVLEGALYIPADFLTPWKRWPHEVEEDPRVRLRVGGRVFACRAMRATDAQQISRLRASIAEKYQISADGAAARAEVWWFRILPRVPD
ncbi:MAG: hypothetical protein HKP27_08500 [Myxococcales bacterium]|nr:hypothetical protein [Myxococcales bacterium]